MLRAGNNILSADKPGRGSWREASSSWLSAHRGDQRPMRVVVPVRCDMA